MRNQSQFRCNLVIFLFGAILNVFVFFFKDFSTFHRDLKCLVAFGELFRGIFFCGILLDFWNVYFEILLRFSTCYFPHWFLFSALGYWFLPFPLFKAMRGAISFNVICFLVDISDIGLFPFRSAKTPMLTFIIIIIIIIIVIIVFVTVFIIIL